MLGPNPIITTGPYFGPIRLTALRDRPGVFTIQPVEGIWVWEEFMQPWLWQRFLDSDLAKQIGVGATPTNRGRNRA